MDTIRPWLCIGNYRDTQKRSYLEFNSIQAILQLAEPVKFSGIESLYLNVPDMTPISPDKLRQGVGFILEEKNKGNKILVACMAGVNRSSAFCIAALKETEGLSLVDAFKAVKQKHPEAMPQEPVWESLSSYYDEPLSYLDIMRISAQYY